MPLRSVCWLMFFFAAAMFATAQEPAAPPATRVGHVVRVPLPITGSIDLQVQKMIEQVLEKVPPQGPRPYLILEFVPKPGQEGEGTQLERAKALARYLTSEEMSRVSTVAWLPKSVRGHAVLAVLACEEIVMHPDATLGDAGHDETLIDPNTASDYKFIAEQRRTIPAAFVRGMLDKNVAVAKVETAQGVRYVVGDELEELKKTEAVKSIDTTVKDPGQAARYSGRDLRLKYGFVSHLVNDRRELERALSLGDDALEADPMLGRNWKPVVVRLDGPIRTDKVNFIIKALEQRLEPGDINFVCVEIDSAGGSLSDSVRLAQYMNELAERDVRTVAYVARQARGDAALIATACDQLVMSDRALLGGSGELVLGGGDEADALQEAVQGIARSRDRHWSLPLALVNPNVAVARYVHQRDQQVAYFSQEELAEQEQPDDWQKTGEQIDTQGGLDGAAADKLQLARFLVEDFGELRQIYHLESEPERLHANWAHLLIEQLANPRISSFLLFVAFLALMFELMTPGIGLPGFVSAVCFMLFFWAQVLHGTAGTLEILLFVGGLAFLGIELFAIPGFGVFGVGGVVMIISSVILASQTFVIPRNAYQLEQLPQGLFMVIAAGSGVVISLAVFRRYIHKAPIVSRMMLQPPAGNELNERGRRESLALYDHLLHKRGKTMTPLTPAGKARFGDDYIDVISDGDFIPHGADVYVIETTGTRVVVRSVE